METRTVFMEIPETVFEMGRQFGQLHALVIGATDGSDEKARLTAKRDYIALWLDFLNESHMKGMSASDAYEAVITRIYEQTSISKTSETDSVKKGLKEGRNLVLQKMHLARG